MKPLVKLIPEKFRNISDKVLNGERIFPHEALLLLDDAPLSLLGLLAVKVKEKKRGKIVFYNRNFHLEPTNICIFNCKFCSYRKPADSPEAWFMGTEEMLDIVSGYKNTGVTEVHIVGGVHQDRDFYYYVDLIKKIKKILPDITVKAFSAVEIDSMINKAGLSLEKGLGLLKESGMEAMPGGGAEIFDEKLRYELCGQKCSSDRWLQVHETAHSLGISSNATMLYGHIENNEHRIDHLSRLRDLQDRTNGFNAFIPLKYRNLNNSLSEIGEVPVTEDMRVLAVTRIYLDNFPHIKAYWPMYGKNTTQLALNFGADDIDGTIDDTTKIYSMAGAEERKPSMTVTDMRKLIEGAGYMAVERDSFYNVIK
ncbi:MAG: CofH family radical SAM protein [Rikenellaceae bacterium]|nr:CofH family radical SAM protein [Rikenellaceae bacterium]